ncbi:HTH-type transcriptional activator Btr [Paenibacillus solanacearum]|uniref:HTH-type transcriptional activator Btr n=2 Tax=Paenibacillus solanacearum TaxID=2048548 RepID=A0A916JRF7_9BACL|nr:HTH-type transcriptional activator Btr [Paenibacillus solanacearum]
MDEQPLWNQTLQLVSHTYWERKERFKMNTDTYPTWVAFAVESGEFEYRIGEKSGMVGPGELIFCPPGHGFEREALSPMALHFVAFEFGDPLPPSVDIPMPSLKSQPTDGKRFASNLAYLRKLHLAIDSRSLQRKQSMLNDMWQLACDEWYTESKQDGLDGLTDSEDELMNRAAKWLYDRAYTPFGMTELSGWLGLSPVQFTRRFQKAFHMTPSELVRTLRIRKAAGLLLDTDLTLEQIAERCGYENGFYLSRVFSRCMNMSPSKYREQNRV